MIIVYSMKMYYHQALPQKMHFLHGFCVTTSTLIDNVYTNVLEIDHTFHTSGFLTK